MIIKKTTGEQVDVNCDIDANVMELKKAVHEATGVPPKYQCFKFRESHLSKSNATLRSYGISQDDELMLSVTLAGGCYESCGCCGCDESCCCNIV